MRKGRRDSRVVVVVSAKDAIVINGYVNVRACIHRVGKACEQTVHGVVATLVLSWTTNATLSPAWVI